MASFYSVFQYIPDAVIDERINIGVIVYDEQHCRVRFLENWKRVHAFSGRDVDFLQDFANQIEDAAQGEGALSLNAHTIDKASRRWIGTIQLTERRGSTLALNELFRDVGSRFLREPKPAKPRARDRRSAFSLARREITAAFRRRGVADIEQHLLGELELAGKVEGHQVKIPPANGKLRAAADALSFEGTDREGMQRDLKATAWTFGDVHAVNRDLQLSVVVLTKTHESQIFQRAANIFDKLDAKIVTENDVASWAESLVEMTIA